MNEEKFSGRAEFYDRYRPAYPDELIDWLYEKTRAEAVADVGAGTGKLTSCLVKKPWRVTAVEPNADMLARLKENVPEAGIIQAPAEHTGIEANSVGLVTVAQAFHWFDERAFREECIRILTPRGRLSILWNERTECALSRERDEICARFCEKDLVDATRKLSSDVLDRFFREEYFSSVEYFCADNPVKMDRDRFLGDMLSRSYALKEGEPNYSRFIGALNDAFTKYERNGIAEIPYRTVCYLGRF